MDTRADDRALIQRLLLEYTHQPYSNGDVRCVAAFDGDRDRYLLMNIGWDDRRVHGCLVNVDLIDGKFWVQRDGTEAGIATELEAAGVPKERIVLGFRAAEVRPLTGYAVA
jgi:hypothetical protein